MGSMQTRRILWLALAVGLFVALENPNVLPLVAAETSPGATVVQWRTLRQLDMGTGAAPPELKKLDKAVVRIAGYMVPLEDDSQEEATEYLIVPIAGGCIHTPPPPPNQIVYCKNPANKRSKVAMFEPQWFEGKLSIAKTGSPYGNVSYQMAVTSVTPYSSK